MALPTNSIDNIQVRYSLASIRLHWLAALMIFGMMGTGLAMEDTIPDMTKVRLLQVHVSLGLLTSLVSLYRIWQHSIERKRGLIPPPLNEGTSFQKKARSLIHLLLRNLMTGLSITGILGLLLSPLWEVVRSGKLAAYQSFESEGVHVAHAILSKVYLLLLILHLGGIALGIVRGNTQVLSRMFPSRS